MAPHIPYSSVYTLERPYCPDSGVPVYIWVFPVSSLSLLFLLSGCNMCTYSGNGTQERAVQDLLCLVDLYSVYLI